MSIERKPFGTNCYGEAVECFKLMNAHGLRIRIMTHGGVVLSIETPDREGTLADIVLGHDTAEEYTGDTPYFGSITGRFANRINQAQFALDGRSFQLTPNDEYGHHLHGGKRGFDKRVWAPTVLEKDNGVQLSYLSPDGEEGYPGNLSVKVIYTLNNKNELRIRYEAETNRATPLNLTNHTYFNLAGHDAGHCGSHQMMICADSFLPANETSIPTGEIRPVAGTPFDFRSPETIDARIESEDEQLRFAGGFDHNYCLNNGGKIQLAAHALEPAGGRTLETFTDQPGIQFYSGNYLDGSVCGKGGTAYVHRGAFCLETQHWPDSPNQPDFPNTILRPGEAFTSETIYRFSVAK